MCNFAKICCQLYTRTSQAKITMSGPNGKWFAVSFNSPNFKMSDKPYTLVLTVLYCIAM